MKAVGRNKPGSNWLDDDKNARERRKTDHDVAEYDVVGVRFSDGRGRQTDSERVTQRSASVISPRPTNQPHTSFFRIEAFYKHTYTQ